MARAVVLATGLNAVPARPRWPGMEVIKAGDIRVRKGIERFHAEGVTFVDGERAAYDAIVLAFSSGRASGA